MLTRFCRRYQPTCMIRNLTAVAHHLQALRHWSGRALEILDRVNIYCPVFCKYAISYFDPGDSYSRETTMYARRPTKSLLLARPSGTLFSTYWASSSRRWFTTTNGTPPQEITPKLHPAYGLLAVSLASGALGYFASRWNNTEAIPTTLKYGSPKEYAHAISELQHTFSDRDSVVSTDPHDLHIHGHSEYDYHPDSLHSVVVYPDSTDDVVKIVKIATKYRMPITPYSGATNLEGHTRGHHSGGICVDLSGMKKIMEIHEADSDMVCQPGIGWVEINDTLEEKGIPLFFPIDPAPGATIGGMLSTGCSGTNAVRYGTSKAEWFLNATVVLPSGEVIKTRRRSRKSSAGFDTTKLFIGAEGTLGIVTEVTIRLAPVLPTSVAVVQFPDVRNATEAVREILNQGVGIQCIELVDSEFMRATNIYGQSKRKWPEKDGLFIKLQGHTQQSIMESAKVVKKVAEKHSGTGFEFAKNGKEAADLWTDRKNAYFSGLALIPGAKGWTTDVCVPVSKLPDLVYQTKEDLKNLGLVTSIVGHVGDGNFHALILFNNEEEHAKTKQAVSRMVKRAIALDGTCTGEHGVGIGKKDYLIEELGEGTVELMKTIKRAIDPLGLFNPGKLYPDTPTKDKGKNN
ncbi:FAD-linked oxidase-like protein [Armillaria novae-zelandiae]|uniref:D-lactate dehydrogenase (cytochrome) n=1 Tax=Armillaria novae-zelandiae TaxID=153914 RepID=A0AA39PVI1_9AGAR|nr:FAD-linked oxidase-like protein [Armillaria novae-zelandiae]